MQVRTTRGGGVRDPLYGSLELGETINHPTGELPGTASEIETGMTRPNSLEGSTVKVS